MLLYKLRKIDYLGVTMGRIPDEWISYIFRERLSIIERMSRGEASHNEIYLSFTRSMPAIVTNGPAGLNASVKMVGLLPREDLIEDLYAKIEDFIEKKPSMRDVVKFLLNEIYVEDRLDFSKLFTLDLAKKNTWRNLNATDRAILIFYTPPITSYMVKAKVTIHMDDIIYRYANAMHDIYHVVPTTGRVVSRAPTYVFHIEEIWNKSANKFGVKIYPT